MKYLMLIAALFSTPSFSEGWDLRIITDLMTDKSTAEMWQTSDRGDTVRMSCTSDRPRAAIKFESGKPYTLAIMPYYLQYRFGDAKAIVISQKDGDNPRTISLNEDEINLFITRATSEANFLTRIGDGLNEDVGTFDNSNFNDIFIGMTKACLRN